MVAGARPGATLELSGTYELTEPLIIARPLTLVGSTDGGARVTATFEGDAVTFTGPGPWTLDGVAFVIEPGMNYAGVRVTRGQFTARGCAFNGAAQRVDKTTGAGLGAWGDARLLLEDCDFSRNRVGLRVESDIVCEVRKSRFVYNEMAGVQARGAARITVADCSLNGNARCAIIIHGDSTARLTGNHVYENGYHGIQITDSAHVLAIANHCNHNEGAGILLGKSSSGTLSDNRCDHNNLYGFVLQGASNSELSGNTADSNLSHGFAVDTEGGATLNDNIARHNGVSGVGVSDVGRCTLLRNTLTDNGEAGLAFIESATGVARENNCEGNGRYAIWIDAGLSVELADNLGEVVEGVDGPSAE